ncbi:MAG: GlxA family transcriptional regulator [Xanthobacteraceae bacterium]|nr:GlxA family transcriptional regulator [Xanthobacteraceae bacterium]
MSYASAIEPLRAANSLAGRSLYAWRHISIDGAPVLASNGVEIKADHSIADDVRLDTVFVCAGGNPTTFRHQPTLRWLRRLARARVRIGGVSGGPYVLARAGVLNGHRCTIHWEHMPAFIEEFPELAVTRSLYVIDRDRLTSSGGISALDMMHALIEQDHGHDLAAAVSEWFLHTEVRLGSGPQRMSARERFDVSNRRLLRALEYMDAHVEEPADRAKLSAVAGVSVRQLERLFVTHLGSTINAHYLRIRLDRARNLLRQTAQPVLAIAVSTGFTTASHFSRAYRRAFGLSPKAERARQPKRNSQIIQPNWGN